MNFLLSYLLGTLDLEHLLEEKDENIGGRPARALRKSRIHPTEEELKIAMDNVHAAGHRLGGRFLGLVGREVPMLVDQFSRALTGREEEIADILWKSIIDMLDSVTEERKLLEDEDI